MPSEDSFDQRPVKEINYLHQTAEILVRQHTVKYSEYQNCYQIEEVLVVADDGAVGAGGDLVTRGATGHGSGGRAEIKNLDNRVKVGLISMSNLRHLFTGFPFCFMMNM